MSQVVGRHLPKTANTQAPASNQYRPVSVFQIDGHNNGALVTVDMPLPITQRVDSINPLVTYIGYAAPALADPAAPAWLIRRITDDGAGSLVIEHAVVPAAGGNPARYATPEHIWNDRLILTYA